VLLFVNTKIPLRASEKKFNLETILTSYGFSKNQTIVSQIKISNKKGVPFCRSNSTETLRTSKEVWRATTIACLKHHVVPKFY
jgi:hypothetical protein